MKHGEHKKMPKMPNQMVKKHKVMMEQKKRKRVK